MSDLDRREFLQAGATTLAAASAIAVGSGSPSLGDEPNASKPTLPTRKLGKTGVDVTILNHGTWQAPDALDRMLRTSYANGVRYFDTARAYRTEPGLAKWFEAEPEVRKNIFLVTKDTPAVPGQMMGMLEKRLAALKVDYVDLFFLHALGDNHPADVAIGLPKSKEFRDAVEQIKKSGKAKFVGFSTHHKNRAQIIQAAAEGGFVDAIMLQYTPWLDKDHPLNRALDSAHAAGIGLISMKQVAGADGERLLREVPKHVPSLKERGLSPFQGLLHAIWTDERISTSCVSMKNVQQINENAAAARNFEPLKAAELQGLRDAFIASKPTFCADCDGRCAVAAGTKANLGDLTRFLTYHEQHGHRAEARQYFAEMADDARDWKGADLAAAQQACPNHLDFADLLPRAERHLS